MSHGVTHSEVLQISLEELSGVVLRHGPVNVDPTLNSEGEGGET